MICGTPERRWTPTKLRTRFTLARIAIRIAVGMALAVLVAYVGDAAWVRVRMARHRDPTRNIEVTVMLAVPLKNGRVEYFPGSNETRRCVDALFPQIGLPPCWYLQRNANRQVLY